jgi:hypothetical protein
LSLQDRQQDKATKDQHGADCHLQCRLVARSPERGRQEAPEVPYRADDWHRAQQDASRQARHAEAHHTEADTLLPAIARSQMAGGQMAHDKQAQRAQCEPEAEDGARRAIGRSAGPSPYRHQQQDQQRSDELDMQRPKRCIERVFPLHQAHHVRHLGGKQAQAIEPGQEPLDYDLMDNRGHGDLARPNVIQPERIGLPGRDDMRVRPQGVQGGGK